MAKTFNRHALARFWGASLRLCRARTGFSRQGEPSRSLSGGASLSVILQQKRHRIDGFTIHGDHEMKVWAERQAGVANRASVVSRR